jgi:hypothetical protein
MSAGTLAPTRAGARRAPVPAPTRPCRALLALLGSLLSATPACSLEPGAQRSPCHFGQEQRVADLQATEVDELRLVRLGETFWALWSEAGGLFARPLDGQGRPRAPARRIGERCAGGFAAVAHGAGVALGCLMPAATPDAAGLARYLELGPTLQLERQQDHAGAGLLSRGVGVAWIAGKGQLAWHDASADRNRIWLAAGAEPGGRVLSPPERAASWPSVLAVGESLRVSWVEAWLDDGRPRGRIVLWEPDRELASLAPILNDNAMPQLFDAPGGLLVAYRDRRRVDERMGLYVGPIAGDSARITRVARADGVARPAVVRCLGGVVAATPRTYAGDYFVGVNFLDARFDKPQGEQQFYEDSHEYASAAVACVDSHALVLIGERARLFTGGGSLRALPYQCR